MTGEPAGPERRARRTTIPGVHRSETPGLGKGAWASLGSPGGFPRSVLEAPVARFCRPSRLLGSSRQPALLLFGAFPAAQAPFTASPAKKGGLGQLAWRMWGGILCKRRVRGVRSWKRLWKAPRRVSRVGPLCVCQQCFPRGVPLVADGSLVGFGHRKPFRESVFFSGARTRTGRLPWEQKWGTRKANHQTKAVF